MNVSAEFHFHNFFENRVALRLGLGCVRDIASAIISHDSIKPSLLCFLFCAGQLDPHSKYMYEIRTSLCY